MWSADTSPKSRRGILRRAVFSEEQRKELERTFRRQKYISKTDRNKLAADLSLKESQVIKGDSLNLKDIQAYKKHLFTYLSMLIIVTILPSALLLMLKVKIWFQNRRMKWRNCKEKEVHNTRSPMDELMAQGLAQEEEEPSQKHCDSKNERSTAQKSGWDT